MKNFWGQELTIGSTVGVGFRNSGSTWHQLGVIVKLEERPLRYGNTETQWIASVIWVCEERGSDRYRWYDGPAFQSQYPLKDLLLIDDGSIDPSLLQALESAYADWVFKHAPSTFIPA